MSFPLRVLVRYVTTGSSGQVPSQFIKDFKPPRFDKNKIYEVFFSSIGTDTPELLSARAEKVFNIDELIEEAGTAQEKKQLENQPGYYYAKIYAFKETQEEFLKFIGSKEGKEMEIKIQDDHKKETSNIPKKSSRGTSHKADIAAGSNCSIKRLMEDNELSRSKRVRQNGMNGNNEFAEESDADEVSENEDSQESHRIKDALFYKLKYVKWKAEALKNVESKEAAELMSHEKDRTIMHLKRDLQQYQKRLADKEQHISHLLSSLGLIAEANKSLSLRIPLNSDRSSIQSYVPSQTPQTYPHISVDSTPSALSDLTTPSNTETLNASLSLVNSSFLGSAESPISTSISSQSSSFNNVDVDKLDLTDNDRHYEEPITPARIPSVDVAPRPLTDIPQTSCATSSSPVAKRYKTVSEDRKLACQSSQKGSNGDAKFMYSIIVHVYEPRILVSQYVKNVHSKIPDDGQEIDNEGFKYLESLLEWRILEDEPGLDKSNKVEFMKRKNMLPYYISIKRGGLRRSLQISDSSKGKENTNVNPKGKKCKSSKTVNTSSGESDAPGNVSKNVLSEKNDPENVIRFATNINVKRKVLEDISNKENEAEVGVKNHENVIVNQDDTLMVL